MVSRETKLEAYVGLLTCANQRTNLVSRCLSKAEIHELAAAFGGTLEATETPARGLLLDIGSGGGLPGIPLAIRYPDLAVVLNESRRLRVEALEQLVAELALDNCTVLPGRFEQIEGDILPRAPSVITAFGVGRAERVLAPVCGLLAEPGSTALLSIPAHPSRGERATWLVDAALLDCTVEVREGILAGGRSILVVRRRES